MGSEGTVPWSRDYEFRLPSVCSSEPSTSTNVSRANDTFKPSHVSIGCN